MTDSQADGRRKPTFAAGVAVGTFVVVAFSVVYIAVRVTSSHRNQFTAIKLVPRVVKLVSGELIVKAGQYRYWTITVDPKSMENVLVIGAFHASGGTGSDIQAMLAEESEFENWKNKHEASVLYSTGQTTNGKFDVPLIQAGTYILAFSNAFSVMTDKEVSAEVELHYLAPEKKSTAAPAHRVDPAAALRSCLPLDLHQ